jgi:hypothetical protein
MGKTKIKKVNLGGKNQPKNGYELYMGLPEELGGPKKRTLEDLFDFGVEVEKKDKKDKPIDLTKILLDHFCGDGMLIDGYNHKKQRVEVYDEVVIRSPRDYNQGNQDFSMSGCDEAPLENVAKNTKNSYKEKKDKSMTNWIKNFDSFCNSYLEFKGLSKAEPSTDDKAPLALKHCSCGTEKKAVRVSLFFWNGTFLLKKMTHSLKWPLYLKMPVFFIFFLYVHIVAKSCEVVKYCTTCQTLPSALIQMGLFPLSAETPKTAVHFAVCDIMVRLRDICKESGEKIADFCNAQYPDSEVSLR